MNTPQLSDIYNFLQLSENLLTSGQPTRNQLELVARAGVTTVINLALPTSSNALPDEENVVKESGMDYIHIPVIWENPTKVDLDKFTNAMSRMSDQKILVHCAANMRVSAFIALYRIIHLGWDRENAFQFTRQIWDPFADPIWQSFIESALAK